MISEEFKIEAVKKLTEDRYFVASVANWIETTTHDLYIWIKCYGSDLSQYQTISYHPQTKKIVTESH